MSRKYFGTDGIRGTVNQGALTPDMASKIGSAAGQLVIRKSGAALLVRVMPEGNDVHLVEAAV